MTWAEPPWWDPERHALRRPALLVRNRLKSAIRSRFEAEGFIEVEPGALQISPGNEVHLHGFSTELIEPDGRRGQLHLHTSPEFACKKLLAAGERRIFDFARCYRNRERGPLHSPEFTLLEWYRAEAPLESLVDDCADLLRIAADAGGREVFAYRGRTMDPRLKPDRLSVAEAFREMAEVDLLASLHADGDGDRDALVEAAARIGVRTAPDDGWSDVFSRILVEKVEPRLGEGRALVLFDWPACEASMARLRPDDRRLAERFELYACGVELVNAFGELTSPELQRRRLEADMEKKAKLYGGRYPIDEDFLRALAVMPEAAGAALGFDRLAMLAAGEREIEAVLWSPTPKL